MKVSLNEIQNEIWLQKVCNILCVIGMFFFMCISIAGGRISIAATMIMLGILALLSNNWQLSQISELIDLKRIVQLNE